MRSRRHVIVAALFLTPLLVGAPISVTSTADTNTAGTLRNAIAISAAGDVITFNCGSPCTITLTSSLPVINHNLTITGGTPNTVIDGAGQFRVFFVDTGTVALSNLTIQNARAQGGAGGTPGGGGGGLGAGAGLFVNQASAVVSVTNCS